MEIPFPSLAVVSRKRLTPYRTILVSYIPAKHHDNWFSLERIFAEKMTDIVFKGTYHRRIHYTGGAGNPVQTPEPSFRIKKPQRETFETFALLSGKLIGGINIHIGGVAQDLG